MKIGPIYFKYKGLFIVRLKVGFVPITLDQVLNKTVVEPKGSNSTLLLFSLLLFIQAS